MSGGGPLVAVTCSACRGAAIASGFLLITLYPSESAKGRCQRSRSPVGLRSYLLAMSENVGEQLFQAKQDMGLGGSGCAYQVKQPVLTLGLLARFLGGSFLPSIDRGGRIAVAARRSVRLAIMARDSAKRG